MTYDNWKTTDPADEWMGPEPPPCEYVKGVFKNGVCEYCGSFSSKACNWQEPEAAAKLREGK